MVSFRTGDFYFFLQSCQKQIGGANHTDKALGAYECALELVDDLCMTDTFCLSFYNCYLTHLHGACLHEAGRILNDVLQDVVKHVRTHPEHIPSADSLKELQELYNKFQSWELISDPEQEWLKPLCNILALPPAQSI